MIVLKELNIDDIILSLKHEVFDTLFYQKIEDSHLWQVLVGNDTPHKIYYTKNCKSTIALEQKYLNLFKKLSINFKYLEGNFKNSFIQVRRINDDNFKYTTIDGDHRLTILKFNGIKTVLCQII